MSVYFVRHAQTDYNKKNLWMGSRDIPLNSEGLKQAEVISRSGQFKNLGVIYTSPLKRACKTAEIIQSRSGSHIQVVVLDGLREREFGPFEGVRKTKINRDMLSLADTVEDEDNVVFRLTECMKEISLFSKGNNKDVLIVSHSYVFRLLIEEMGYKSIPAVGRIDNAQCVKIIG